MSQKPSSGRSGDRLVTLSIVSHGQGHLLRQLLDDLECGVDAKFEVLLTLNLPEDESFLNGHAHLPLEVIRNPVPKGFGANHNAAFLASRGDVFAVLNPDIRARPLRLAPLLETLSAPDVAVCGPLVMSSAGHVEDNARRFPSWGRLARRFVLGQRELDYQWGEEPIEVDWLAGMFLLFRREAFSAVAGFDERFFMYFEDADICRRLRKRGWSVRLDPRVAVVHDAQRASHRSVRHLRWHLSSALRYLTGV